MQEQKPSRTARNVQIPLKIKMEPKSLQIMAPLEWEIGKVKCLLCTIIPKLEFGMVKLLKDGVELESTIKIKDIFNKEGPNVLEYQRGENKKGQFDKYYASKWIPLFASMKHSPFQPLLHPQYYALHTQLVQTQQITSTNLRANLQNIMNVRNLINLNNQNNPVAANNNNNEEAVNADVGGGLFGRPNAGGNIFQRGMFWVFKIIQLLLMWQLLSFVVHNISPGHICIMVGIVVSFLVIEHFQRRRRNQPKQEEQRQEEARAEGNDVNRGDEVVEEKEQGQNEQNNEEDWQDVEQQSEQKQDKKTTVIHPQGQRVIYTGCLFLQSLVAFVMSLFPNWTIHLHLNILAPFFNRIDPLLKTDTDNNPKNESEKQDRQEQPKEQKNEEQAEQESEQVMVHE